MRYEEAVLRLGEKTRLIMAFGEEEFFLESLVLEFTNRLRLDRDDKIVTWSASEHTAREIAVYLMEPSLTGRVVMVLMDPTKLNMAKILQETLDHMPEDAYLIVLCKKESPPKWMDVYKKSCLWVECPKMEKRLQIIRWAKEKAQIMGLPLDDIQLSILVERTDGDLRKVTSELDKLKIYVLAGGELAPSDLKTLIYTEPTSDLIPVLDAIYARDVSQALRMLNKYYSSYGTYLPFIALFQKNLARMALMVFMSHTKSKIADIVSAVKLPPFIVAKELPKAQRLGSVNKYKTWLRDLCLIERDSRRDPTMVGPKLEQLIIGMAQK